MSLTNLRDRAFAFFKDKDLTEKWLATPCPSFGGKTPEEYYQSSTSAQEEIEKYLELFLTQKAK